MYPRNAASPEPVAIGAVVQISDGAVQTSGVTVRIKPIGVSEGDGAGTTAYSTDGIVEYTPTQAETNYTSFILIAKKTGCIPVSTTVVTSASAVAGYAGLDWSHINAPTTTVGLTGTTIGILTTYTNNTPQTGDNFARIGATGSGLTSLAPSSTALSTAQWTNARAGYLDNINNATILSAVFPTDPADQSLIIAATNNILSHGDSTWATATSVTVSDKTGFSLSTAGVAAIWDALTSGITTAGSIGKYIKDSFATILASFTGAGNMKSDMLAIDGSTTAANLQKRAALVIYAGSVTGASTTTALTDSGLTEVATHWIGRIIVFENPATLKRQASKITDSIVGGLTFDALTSVPQAGDTYLIV